MVSKSNDAINGSQRQNAIMCAAARVANAMETARDERLIPRKTRIRLWDTLHRSARTLAGMEAMTIGAPNKVTSGTS